MSLAQPGSQWAWREAGSRKMGETPQVYKNEGYADWELEPQTRTDGPFERLVHCRHQDLEAVILPTTPTIAGIYSSTE